MVCKVLEVLAKYMLYLCLEKYEFDKLCIKYLSLVILEDQVKIDPIKIVRVCNWLILVNCIKL